MRKPTPPRPVKLTSQDTLEYTISLLQEYLTLLAHSGTKWQTSDVWQVLVRAAADGATIDATCADWTAGPDANTIRLILRTCMTNDQIDAIETAVNLALRSRFPARLRRPKLDVAFDLHDEPYYGHAAGETEFICRGALHAGTTYHYRCATAYVLSQGVRITLAIRFVRRQDTLPAVVTWLRRQLTAQNVKMRRLLMDKGFCSIEILTALAQDPVPVILACPIRGKVKGTRTLCQGRRSYRTQHTFTGRKQAAITVPVMVVRTYKRRRNGQRKAVWLLYVTLHCRPALDTIRHLYRRRFGIEASYRLMECVRIRTSSPCSAWRYLFMGLAVLLLLAWNLLQWLYTVVSVRGRKQLCEGLLRLSRFLRFLARAIDACYSPLTAIQAPASNW